MTLRGAAFPRPLPSPAHFAAYCVTAVLLALFAAELAFTLPLALGHSGTVGLDLAMYSTRVDAWLAGDGFYRARQLAGPYTIEAGDALYPPTLLILLVPLRLVPPLWWAIPLGVTGYALWRHRPAWWAWPLLALCLAWPKTLEIVLYGNPAMWAAAAIAAGTVWGWPFAFAALKPILAPFALLGIRRRSWWLAVAVGLALSLPFGALWLDYARALLGARNEFGAFYLLGDLPLAAAPLIAWVGATSGSGRRGSSRRDPVRPSPDGAPARHRWG